MLTLTGDGGPECPERALDGIPEVRPSLEHSAQVITSRLVAGGAELDPARKTLLLPHPSLTPPSHPHTGPGMHAPPGPE